MSNLSFDKMIDIQKLEIQEERLLKLFSNNSKLTVFDIGSCEGINSIRYSKLFPKSKIYSIEAVPDNFNIIQSNINKTFSKNVTIFNTCFSNKVGEATFNVSSGQPEKLKEQNPDWDYGNKSSSLLKPSGTSKHFPWLKFEDTITVETTTLDIFCDENKIEQIDFIHMDVQGAEIMVLEGASKQLDKLKSIWLEVENVPLYEDQPLKNEVENFLKKRDFIKVIDTVKKVAGDQFWISKELLIEKEGTISYYKHYLKSLLK